MIYYETAKLFYYDRQFGSLLNIIYKKIAFGKFIIYQFSAVDLQRKQSQKQQQLLLKVILTNT